MRSMIATVLIAVATAGCSWADFGNKTYEAQRAQIPGAAGELIRLVVDYANAQGWTVVASSGDLVEALTAGEELGNVRLRSRWFFMIEANEIVVEKRLEAQFDLNVDAWASHPDVCETYEYAAERLHLAELERIGQSRGLVLVASAGDHTRAN